MPRHCVKQVKQHLTDNERLPNQMFAQIQIKRERKKNMGSSQGLAARELLTNSLYMPVASTNSRPELLSYLLIGFRRDYKS